MKVWLDGQVVEEDGARIGFSDRGFTSGDGVFEILKASRGKPLRLGAHLARLHAGVGMLGIPLPCSDREIGEAVETALAANGCADAMVHLVVRRDPGPLATIPEPKRPSTMAIAVAPAVEARPVRVVVATVTRRNEFSPTSRVCTLNQVDNVLARREAQQKGADDALLLNSQGRLADTTCGNVFLVIDGDVLTPPISEGALPGVMRAEVIESLGAATAQLNPADLLSASEVFLTDAGGVRAVLAIDGRAVGSGREGPVTSRLKAAFV